jgi:hypothetical protein
MRVQLISNINLHLYKTFPNIKDIVVPKADTLILAGNICFVKHHFFLTFFQKLSPMFKNIIYIFGPNEYYCMSDLQMETTLALETYARDMLSDLSNVHILQQEHIKINNIVFFGCTLWSYISKRDLVIKTHPLVQNSFVRHGTKILLNPIITNKLYLTHKIWLERMIDTFALSTIVPITYTLPSFQALEEKFTFLTKSNYGNCDRLAALSDAWCSGVGKITKIVDVDRTPLYINPYIKGEPNEFIFLV